MKELKKVSNTFEIIENNEEVLYTINKKNNKICVYNKDLLENIIDKNFNKKYKELLYLVMTINDDEDSSDSDTELALLKIEDLKNYILSHYQKYIGKDLLNKYLKMMMILEGKLLAPKKKMGRGR